MSVALECLKGDEFFCIHRFHACPHGESFSWKSARRFDVGEPLRFVSVFLDEHFKQHPSGWMVVFDARDGKRYAATQTYFVTAECWQGLKDHFVAHGRGSPASKKVNVDTPRPPGQKKQIAVTGSKKRRIA